MSLILAIEKDSGQADAVRRAVRTLPGVDLVLVDSRDAALAALKGRIPELILLSALMPPGDEAALTAHLRTVAAAGHVEMITIPLLEHAAGDEGRRGLFGVFGRRRNTNEGRISSPVFAGELRAHLDRIAEAQETSAFARKRRLEEKSDAIVVAPSADADFAFERQWTGLRDSFGEREFGVDEEGQSIERLRLVAEFTDARDTISDRIVRLMDVPHPSIAQAFRLENDGASGRLILVSERVSGVRLSELLRRASEHEVVPDLPAALFVMRRLLAAAGRVHKATGVTHLAVAPERIVITPRGEVVIVEAALAAAIQARSRRVHEMDVGADLAQIAMAGLSIMLGRAIAPDVGTEARGQLLEEAADVAAIRVGEAFAAALGSWFDQALGNDGAPSFPDFQEASVALECTSPSAADGSIPLRRTLKTFLHEVVDLSAPEEAAIEATRVRVARARQIARRHSTFASPEAAPPEPETSFALADPVPFAPTETEQVDSFVAPLGSVAAPLEESVGVEPAEETPEPLEPPVVEAPPAPQPERRRPTLLELFRSARDGESEPETAPPAAVRESLSEPIAAPTAPEPPPVEIFAQPTEMFAAAIEEPPAEEAADAFVAEAPQLEAAAAADEPVEESDEEIQPPIEEAPPPPPPQTERRRPSLRELFRSSRPRAREPEHLSILATDDTPPETVGTTPDVETRRTEIFAAATAQESAIPETRDEPPPDVAPQIEEAPLEKPQPARRSTLLDFLRSSRSRKSKPEPEPPPAPEAAREPVVAASPETSQPLSDIFAELIQAARAVAPPPRPAPARAEPEAPVSAEPAAEIFAEPIEPASAAADAPDAEWETAEPAAPESSDWPAWSVPEPDRSEPRHEEKEQPWSDSLVAQLEPVAASETIEPPPEEIQPPADDDWPTWNALESPAVQPSHEEPVVEESLEDIQTTIPEPAPPKSRRKPSLLELFRSSRSTDSSEAESAAEPAPPIEYAAPPPSPEQVVEPFDSPEIAEVPEPPEVPAFADVPAPVPPIAPKPIYIEPPPISVAPPQPAYAPPPPPTYVAPPSSPPISIAPRIAIEPPVRMAPAAPRPIDAGTRSTPAPAAFKGPVTRRSATSAQPRRWTRVAVVALAVVCLAIAGRAYYLSAPAPVGTVEEPAPKPTTVNAKGTGSLAVTTEPAGARVTLDGKPRGITPLTIPNLRPGSHKVVLDSSEGTVRRDVKIVAGRETALDESIYAGWVAVYAPFELQISEGTRLLGSTDSHIMLAPGRHQLELTNSQLGYRETRGVEVTPGETTTINIKAAEGIVHISAPDGADVWIDGERVGVTPLGDLRMPIGARDIIVRHPDLGEQHTVANVTIGSRAEVTIDFRRPKNPGV